MTTAEKRLFVGIGSPHGDDQVGWAIADRLSRDRDLGRQVVIRKALVPVDLIDFLGDVDHLHICDACDGGDGFGKLFHWTWTPATDSDLHGCGSLPPTFICTFGVAGSHAVSVLETLELAARLMQMPTHVNLWGIAGRSFGPNQSMSPEIESNLDNLTDQLMHAILTPAVVYHASN